MVRGLTTFITERMDMFMDICELPHDSPIIIDGNSVAINIYFQLADINFCFGGEYDKYVDAVRTFFRMLFDCKIVPHVLLDGATEPNKDKCAQNKLAETIQKSILINCLNENEIQVLPLLIIEVFKSVLKEMNISMVICDFDCDKEVANIASALNCPVLSYDSDYFIFDVKYIPFFLNNGEPNLYQFRKVVPEKETNRITSCKFLRGMIFNRQKFLQRLGLTQNKLPILSILLGNDYIDRVQNYNHLFKFLKIKWFRNFIESVMRWLAMTKLSEALEKITNFFMVELKQENKKKIIDEVIDFYSHKKSPFIKYLEVSSDTKEKVQYVYLDNISTTFVDKYRQGFYCHHFLDLMLFNKYHPKPLIESCNKENTHTVSFPVISAIYKVLTNNSKEELVFCGRTEDKFGEQIVPRYEKSLPNYENLQEMDNQNKYLYFFEILDIQKEFINNCLDLFPQSWHVMLITLKYLGDRSKLQEPLLYSIIICKTMISCIDKKIGRIRSLIDLNKFVSKYTHNSERKPDLTEFSDAKQALEEIDINDCVKFLEKLLPFFEISRKMKEDENLFDRDLVHSMSEFESCLFHVIMLNDLFDLLFAKCAIWECYNGRFLYNLFSKLKNDLNFLNVLLEASPTILQAFNFIKTSLKTHILCNL